MRSSADVLWNTASFSEMPEEIVRNYGRHLTPLVTGATCLIMNKSGQDQRTSGPSIVMDAMGGQYEAINPACELEGHSRYALRVVDEKIRFGAMHLGEERRAYSRVDVER